MVDMLGLDSHRPAGIQPKAINSTSPVNLVTDASFTRASGVLSQGEPLPGTDIVAFWSGKFNSAQQNY
ncbi:hypothetical protein BDR06DRAFT_960707, partial [Suillus hirtellus]